jgi:hypothetical protein
MKNIRKGRKDRTNSECYFIPNAERKPEGLEVLQWQALKSITCVGVGILHARPSG